MASPQQTVTLKAPPHACGVSFQGVEYKADAEGLVEVPASAVAGIRAVFPNFVVVQRARPQPDGQSPAGKQKGK